MLIFSSSRRSRGWHASIYVHYPNTAKKMLVIMCLLVSRRSNLPCARKEVRPVLCTSISFLAPIPSLLIVGKRRRVKGYEYKVCWKETWLLERELGNAQKLLWDFEAKRQGQ